MCSGHENITTNNYAHCFGVHNTVGAEESVAIGSYLSTYQRRQIVLGQYNASFSGGSRSSVVVGNGADSENKANCLTLNGLTGNMWIKGTLTQNSDRRLKEHIAYLAEDACEFVRKLKPALFVKDGERHLGFYAQNVDEADEWGTSTVAEQHTDESLDFDPLTLEYTALIAPIVAYAQSLEKRIEQLEKRLSELEERGMQ